MRITTQRAENQYWYFEQVNLYRFICQHTSENFEQKHQCQTYKKGDFIYLQNDISKYIYVVVKGKIKIGQHISDGNEIIKTIVGKGDIFGELALIGEKHRTDFAQAIFSNTSICRISIQDMHVLIHTNKALGLKLYQLMGLRVKKLERKLESLIAKSASGRIIEFLREKAYESGVRVGEEIMIKNYLTHKDIALLTGTSRQTVTTTLNSLKMKNLINFSRRQILIRNLNSL